jgi:hypothetical protein
VSSNSSQRKRQFSRRKRRRDIKPKIESEIRRKALVEGWTAADIHGFLNKEANDGAWNENDVPSVRTIQRVVKDLKIQQDTSVWSPMGDVGEEDSRFILDVLRVAISVTEGRKCSFTIGESEMLLKLKRAMPDASPFVVWILLRLYMLYEANGDDTLPLDTYLAYAPWRDYTSFRLYCHAIVRKYVQPPPVEALEYIVPLGVIDLHLHNNLWRLVNGTLTQCELERLLEKKTIVMPEPVDDDEPPDDWEGPMAP